MKCLRPIVVAVCFGRLGFATQADDTTVTIDGHLAGATPFLSQVTLSVSDTTAIKNIRFAVARKADSLTRPLSAAYSHSYLAERGDINEAAKKIFLSVYGLYDDYTNTVTLTYSFNDGSSKQASTTIATTVFDHPCGYIGSTATRSLTIARTYSLIVSSREDFLICIDTTLEPGTYTAVVMGKDTRRGSDWWTCVTFRPRVIPVWQTSAQARSSAPAQICS